MLDFLKKIIESASVDNNSRSRTEDDRELMELRIGEQRVSKTTDCVI